MKFFLFNSIIIMIIYNFFLEKSNIFLWKITDNSNNIYYTIKSRVLFTQAETAKIRLTIKQEHKTVTPIDESEPLF